MSQHRPIFKSSVGASEHHWNNMRLGTTREVVCELCGNILPELDPEDDSRTLGRFLGMQFVEECCGKAIDHVYDEFGEEFTMEFLREFSENPLEPKFGLLLMCLNDIVTKARNQLAKADDNLKEVKL